MRILKIRREMLYPLYFARNIPTLLYFFVWWVLSFLTPNTNMSHSLDDYEIAARFCFMFFRNLITASFSHPWKPRRLSPGTVIYGWPYVKFILNLNGMLFFSYRSKYVGLPEITSFIIIRIYLLSLIHI